MAEAGRPTGEARVLYQELEYNFANPNEDLLDCYDFSEMMVDDED